MKQHHSLILASQSSARQDLLKAARLQFDIHVSHVDETAEKDRLSAQNATAHGIALSLAEQKAVNVSSEYPDHLVIGADQTMECGGRLYDKPADMDAARQHLSALAGKTHTLFSAVAIARNKHIVWRHVDKSNLHMRPMTTTEIDGYIAVVGDDLLSSVGCYRLEDGGSRLFDHIDGDYFTILGLPLLPLLAYLREAGAID